MAPKNNWNTYERYVVSKLESHDKLLSDIACQNTVGNNSIAEVKGDIVGIKVALDNIKSDKKTVEGHTKDIGDLKVASAELQVKSGVWGILGGIVTTAIIILAMLLKTDFGVVVSHILGN